VTQIGFGLHGGEMTIRSESHLKNVLDAL